MLGKTSTYSDLNVEIANINQHSLFIQLRTFAAMKVHRNLNDLPQFRNSCITIGSFDGLHCGHQKIIKKVKDLAVAGGGESVVITFHPHPRQIIYPKDNSLRLITTIDEKIALFEKTGIDHLVIVPFSFEFSQQSADEYIQRFLVAKFQPKHIVVGYDHRFGMNRRGDINYLRWHEKSMGYKVVEIQKEEVQSITVSSTKVRDAVERGDVKGAAELLGHFFTLTGKVVKGQQIGQTLGFPTANLQIEEKHKLIPKDGIYAVYANYDGERHKGMLYIGDRPTLKHLNNKTIEVHIFDFNKTIYDDEVQLELVDFIRDDKDLKNLEVLKEQLARDEVESKSKLKEAEKKLTEWSKGAMPSVAVVILNYNGKAMLEKYLPSVLETTYPNYEIIIADNASKDESMEFLLKNYPQIRVIDLGQNHGFAKGYNLALEGMEPDIFVLLNSDVKVPKGWLEPLVESLQKDPEVAVVMPKVRSDEKPNSFEYAGAAGGWIDSLGYPFCRGRIFDEVEVDKGQFDHEVEVFWATGACFAIKAPLFHSFGGFDAEFFAHQEEIDLCWRLKRAGYKIMYTPRSVVYHLGGGTLNYQSPYKTFLNFRNSYYLLLKNELVVKLLFVIPLRLVLDTVAALQFLFKGKWLHAQAVFSAFFSVIFASVTFIKKRLDLGLKIERLKISPQPNRRGVLPRSIVFQYFIMGKKKFLDL